MSDQPITPELQQWIIEQATAGLPPEIVLKSMLASGWDEDVAIAALEDTLTEHLARQRTDPARAQDLPGAVPVPEPLPGGTCTEVWADGHQVTVIASMNKPRVVMFANLLTPDECNELIALARQRLARSQTVDADAGANEVNDARTSQGMFFERGENPLCTRIEARMAALMNWPVENGEGLQILRYGPGAEY